MSKWHLLGAPLLVTHLVISLGCSLGGEYETTGDGIVHRFRARGSIVNLVKNAEVTCVNSATCSEPSAASIGLVGFRKSGSSAALLGRVSQCTGFLLENNTVVGLASHCVDGIEADNCSQSLAIHFPAIKGHAAEMRVCKEILTASSYLHQFTNDNGNTVQLMKGDYAFFRIDPINRPVLKLASQPAAEGEQIQVTKINPVMGQGRYMGRLDSISCRATSNTLNYPDVQSQWSANGVGLDDSLPKAGLRGKCEVRPGNSGSPVLNSRGEVIGVASQFRMIVETLAKGKEEADIWAMVLSPSQRGKVRFALQGTMSSNTGYANLMCADLPFLNRQPNERCEPYNPLNRALDQQVEAFRRSRLAAVDEGQATRFSAEVPRSLQHTWRRLGGEYDLSMHCVAEDPSRATARYLSVPYRVRHQVVVHLDSNLRVVDLTEDWAYDRRDIDLQRVAVGSYRLTVNAQSASSSTADGQFQGIVSSQDLPSCGSAQAAVANPRHQ